jgi:hypothetical protein
VRMRPPRHAVEDNRVVRGAVAEPALSDEDPVRPGSRRRACDEREREREEQSWGGGRPAATASADERQRHPHI